MDLNLKYGLLILTTNSNLNGKTRNVKKYKLSSCTKSNYPVAQTTSVAYRLRHLLSCVRHHLRGGPWTGSSCCPCGCCGRLLNCSGDLHGGMHPTARSTNTLNTHGKLNTYPDHTYVDAWKTNEFILSSSIQYVYTIFNVKVLKIISTVITNRYIF